jgi:hypothetical protein
MIKKMQTKANRNNFDRGNNEPIKNADKDNKEPTKKKKSIFLIMFQKTKANRKKI